MTWGVKNKSVIASTLSLLLLLLLFSGFVKGQEAKKSQYGLRLFLRLKKLWNPMEINFDVNFLVDV